MSKQQQLPQGSPPLPPAIQQSQPLNESIHSFENHNVSLDRLSNALSERKLSENKYRVNNKAADVVDEIIGRQSLSLTKAKPIVKPNFSVKEDGSHHSAPTQSAKIPVPDENKLKQADFNYDVFSAMDVDKPGPEMKMINWEDLSSTPDFLNRQYLEGLRKVVAELSEDQSQESDVRPLSVISINSDGGKEEQDDDNLTLQMVPFGREWFRMDDQQTQRALATKKMTGASVGDKGPALTQLPMPSLHSRKDEKSAVRVDSNSIRARLLQQRSNSAAWQPPESWGIQSADQASVTIDKSIETRTTIRVFRREGNFATVSCAYNITGKELSAILCRKFFISEDQAPKFNLYLMRRGFEVRIMPEERPLRLQQQLLWEFGYDPAVDRFQDISREDNSYLYRWIFSDCTACTDSMNRLAANPALLISGNLSGCEQKLKIIHELEQEQSELSASPASQSIVPTIDLSGINLSSLPPVVTSPNRSKTVLTLDLSNNFMIELPEQFALQFFRLTTLRLQGSELIDIPSAVSQLKSLQTLDLSHNLIRTIKNSGLQRLEGLRELNLCNNRLSGRSALPLYIFNGLRCLERLDLGCNWLRGQLPTSVLALISLQDIDVSQNFLTALPEDIGLKLVNLQRLNLAGNQLQRLPDSLLASETAPPIVFLDIRQNNIRGPLILASKKVTNTAQQRKILADGNHISNFRIESTSAGLQSLISHRNPELLQIQLNGQLDCLTTLVATHSKLAFLHDNLFEFAPNIQVLILNHNQLSSLPDSLSSLGSLVRLEVAHNSLSRLPSSLAHLKALEVLDLHSNNLRELPADIWEISVSYLNLSSNSIEKWPENPMSFAPTIGGRLTIAETISRRSSTGPSTLSGPLTSVTTGLEAFRFAPLSDSLCWFSVADNRLDSSFFETAISHFLSLRYLNCSYNEIFQIPNGGLKTLVNSLEELHLSGNQLTQLPDDISFLKVLKRLYLNANRLGNLPFELARLTNLRVLDVGKNQLRYNVSNWPHDWNWNKNPELRVLELSGNPRLEIRSLVNAVGGQFSNSDSASGNPNITGGNGPATSNVGQSSKKDRSKMISDNSSSTNIESSINAAQSAPADRHGNARDLARFDRLRQLSLLGLLDVGVFVSVPQESPNRRIRLSAFGGSTPAWQWLMGIEVNGSELGASAPANNLLGQSIAQQQDNLNAAAPSIHFGVSSRLDREDQIKVWEVLLYGSRLLQNARDEADVPDFSNEISRIPSLKPQRRGIKTECIAAMFEAETISLKSFAKWLADSFSDRFSYELKRLFKERYRAAGLAVKDSLTDTTLSTASDAFLVQHALRRTFVLLDKHLAGLAFSAEYNIPDSKDQQQQPTGQQEKVTVQLSATQRSFTGALPEPAAASRKQSLFPLGESSTQALQPPAAGRRRKSSVAFLPIAEEENFTPQDASIPSVSVKAASLPSGQPTQLRGRLNSSAAAGAFQKTSVVNSNSTMHNLVRLASGAELSYMFGPEEAEDDDAQHIITAENSTEEHDKYDRSTSDEAQPSTNEKFGSLGLLEQGVNGVVVFMSTDGKLFVANCGDAMVVLSRNGVAVPLTMRHALFPNNNQAVHQAPTVLAQQQTIAPATTVTPPAIVPAKPPVIGTAKPPKSSLPNDVLKRLAEQGNNSQRVQRQTPLLASNQQQKQEKIPNKQDLLQSNMSKKEMLRIRQNCGLVTSDGMVGRQRQTLTRSFGHFNSLPYLICSPYLSITDCCDQCEFLIIGSGAFWSVMNYQTAVEIAKQRADDAVEAAMVLRDFAETYAAQAIYSTDEDSELGAEKQRCQRNRLRLSGDKSAGVRYRPRDSFTVMVINLRDWHTNPAGGNAKGAAGNGQVGSPLPPSRRPFNKVRRRKDEATDSAMAHLAPEIEPPTGNVALVFTDVRNSTQLWERRSIAMRVAIREHNQIMRRNLRLCNGYEVKTEGDAFMVAFKNVVDALRWCLSVQMQLLEAEWPQEILEAPEGVLVYGPKSIDGEEDEKVLLYRGLSVRMGIHVGNPVCELDPVTRRMDYFGPMVNKTARVSGSADGGQLFVSSDVHHTYQCLRTGNWSGEKMPQYSAKDKAALSERFKILQQQLQPVFVNIGERKLKGLDNPEILFSVMPKALAGRHKVPPPALPGDKPKMAAPETNLSDPSSLLSKLTSVSNISLGASINYNTGGDIHSTFSSTNRPRNPSRVSTGPDKAGSAVTRRDSTDGQLDTLLLRIQTACLNLLESRILGKVQPVPLLITSNKEIEMNYDKLSTQLIATDGGRSLERLVYRLELIASTLATALEPSSRLDAFLSPTRNQSKDESAQDAVNTFRLLLDIAKDRLLINL